MLSRQNALSFCRYLGGGEGGEGMCVWVGGGGWGGRVLCCGVCVCACVRACVGVFL